MITFVVYYVLSGGTFNSIKFWLFLPIALMIHWFGFGHNSLMDTARGYDTKDPHKQHHPLVAGLVSLDEAHKVIHTGLVFMVAYTGWYALCYASNPALTLAFAYLGYAFGHAYNDGLDKVTHWKWVPEAMTAVCYAVAVNYINRTYIDTLFILAILVTFFIHAFEIFFEGELKEIEFMYEVNILRSLGSGVRTVNGEKVLYLSTVSRVFSWFIQIVKFGLMLYVAYQLSLINLIATIPFIVGMTYLTYLLLTSPRPYDHEQDLNLMAGAEVLAFFGSVAMVLNLVGILEAILIYIFSVLWLVAFNKMQWGEATVGPKV